MKNLKDLLGLSDRDSNGSDLKSELESSAKFWRALLELAESDLDLALKLNDDGFVETATERIDLAQIQLEKVLVKLNRLGTKK